MRTMKHDTHSTRRRGSRRTSSPAPHRPAGGGPRPVGDGLSLRGGLVAAALHHAPGPPLPDRAKLPARLPGPGRRGAVPRQARARPRPGPARPRHLAAARTAGAGPHLDQRPAGRGASASRRRAGRPPGAPLPEAAQGRLPPHRQHPRAQAGPPEGAARRGDPFVIEKKVAAGKLRLFYLDESGFSPSLPTGYSWCLPLQRKRVRYEYPQGRRVNVLAAYEPFYGPAPWLGALPLERTLTSDDLLAYLRQRPPEVCVPRVVVLDNASMHVSKAFKAQRKALADEGIYLYYLPAYSPELNKIEAVFKQVKHHEIPRRSHASKAELRQSVEQGFASYARKMQDKRCKHSRPAA